MDGLLITTSKTIYITMTWLLQHDDDILVWQEFDSEDAAREWADYNILRDDRRNWTLIDPEGGDWMV